MFSDHAMNAPRASISIHKTRNMWPVPLRDGEEANHGREAGGRGLQSRARQAFRLERSPRAATPPPRVSPSKDFNAAFGFMTRVALVAE
jgi:hypothetical protein